MAALQDQHVDRTELLLGLADQVLALRLVGDVAGDDDRLAAGLADLGRGLVAGRLLARRHHDLGALQGQVQGDRLADALARAGDDGDLAGEIEERRCHENFLRKCPPVSHETQRAENPDRVRAASQNRGVTPWRG